MASAACGSGDDSSTHLAYSCVHRWGHAENDFNCDYTVIMVHVHGNVLYFSARRLQEQKELVGKKCKRE